MGYMKQKYTKAYFLKEESNGIPTVYGVEGIDDFKKGSIRKQDMEILRHLKFKEKNVLDLGFGRGEAIKFAADNRAKKIVGVDFSEDANIIARDFLNKYHIKADLYCNDVLDFLKFYVNQENIEFFDIVLMLDFIEHIPRFELTEILKLIHRIISNRAAIVINTPVFPVDNDVIAEGLNPIAKDTSENFIETTGMHCNKYTKESLRLYMEECRFQAITGHFFISRLSNSEYFKTNYCTRLETFIHNYPVKLSLLWYVERFEYV